MTLCIRIPSPRAIALVAASLMLVLSVLGGTLGSVVLDLATRHSGRDQRIKFPSSPHALIATVVYGMFYWLMLLITTAGIMAIALRQRRHVAIYALALVAEYIISTVLGATAFGMLTYPRNREQAIQHCAASLTGMPLATFQGDLSGVTTAQVFAIHQAQPRCTHAYTNFQALVLTLWLVTRIAEPLFFMALMAYRRSLPNQQATWNSNEDPEQGALPPYVTEKTPDTESLPEYTPGAYTSSVTDEKDFDLDDEDPDSPWGAAGDSSMVDIDLMAEAAAGDEKQYTSPNEGFKVFYVNMAHHHRPRPRQSKSITTPHTVFTRHAQSMDLDDRREEQNDSSFAAAKVNSGSKFASRHHPHASVPTIPTHTEKRKQHPLTESYSSALDTRLSSRAVGYETDDDPEAMPADEGIPGGTYDSYLSDPSSDAPIVVPGPTYRAASYGTSGSVRAIGPEPDYGHGYEDSGPRYSHDSDRSAGSHDSERTVVVTCRLGDEGEDDKD